MWAHMDSHKDLHDPERISIRVTEVEGKGMGSVDLRQTARYVSCKDGFTGDQQRIAV